MATNDTSAGLLSKMAKFVRNPTKDWSDLDKPEPVQDGGYSKQALKEMIERKRQNDFVRRREFDYLRKLRRNGISVSADLAGRPSFFQTSTASNLDERATTLKKIDEIEAHMSKQWWRGKQDEPTVQGPMASEVDLENIVPEEGDSLSDVSTQPAALNSDSDLMYGSGYESTKMGLPSPAELALVMGPQSIKATKNKGASGPESVISEFSTSKLFSYELGANLADPELEEAAIRFANGDDAGAEASLLAALKASDVNQTLADGWAAALFDLYRATGQQARFDSVAIDYAQRFGRSAPAWFSVPELLGTSMASTVAGQESAPEPTGHTLWECPVQLDFQALQALLANALNTHVPLHLNWRRLCVISPDAAKGLSGLFSEWCAKPVKLHFIAQEVLEKVLKSLTPSGDKQVDMFWWKLRLDTMRILHLQDEFELAALDYCVTYEVSPPPWSDARCELLQESISSAVLSARGPHLSNNPARDESADFSNASTMLMSMDLLPVSVVELTGEVLGDAAEAMDKLQVGLTGSNRLVISCSRLIRVDFSAAGSILNWAAVREADGCHVQFRDVPRLVAAFFNVIGINEHARVILRTT